jgi:hypothetical protein
MRSGGGSAKRMRKQRPDDFLRQMEEAVSEAFGSPSTASRVFGLQVRWK